jgi:hypothetical protein
MTCFAIQVDNGPVIFPLLYEPKIQVHCLVAPKSACKQDGQECDHGGLSTTENRTRWTGRRKFQLPTAVLLSGMPADSSALT